MNDGPGRLRSPRRAQTSRCAVILWDKPDGYETLAHYEVMLNGRPAGTFRTADALLDGLQPDTAYTVTVCGVGKDGARRPGDESLSLRTRPEGERLDVRQFGATGDRPALQTAALQSALDACPPGGTVFVPPGTYRTGALFLRRSGVTLELAAGSRLLGSDDPADYPSIPCRFEGIERTCFASLITIGALDRELEDVAIVGAGTIDGSGTLLREREIASPGGRESRGRVICAMNVTGFLLQGVTVRHSPAWCIHPIYCRDVTMYGITVNTALDEHGNEYREIWNGDGIDPDSCDRVAMVNCRIISEDDGVAIKSGRNEDGRRVGRPCRDVRVSNCRFERGFGVALGSEMSGDIVDVLVEDCTFRQTATLATIKTQRGRGGTVERCRFRDLVYEQPRYAATEWFLGPISIDMMYGLREDPEAQPVPPVDERTPHFRDISLRHIRLNNRLGCAAFIRGIPESPIENLVIEDLAARAAEGFFVQHVRGFSLRDYALEAPVPGFRLHNVSELDLRGCGAVQAPGIELEKPPMEGAELLVNGDFSAGFTGWQAVDARLVGPDGRGPVQVTPEGEIRQSVSTGLVTGAPCELIVNGCAGREFRYPAFGARVFFLDAAGETIGTLSIRQIGRLGVPQRTRGTIPPGTVRVEAVVSCEGTLTSLSLRQGRV